MKKSTFTNDEVSILKTYAIFLQTLALHFYKVGERNALDGKLQTKTRGPKKRVAKRRARK